VATANPRCPPAVVTAPLPVVLVLASALAASACGGVVQSGGDAAPDGAADAPLDTTRPSRDSGAHDSSKASPEGGRNACHNGDGGRDGGEGVSEGGEGGVCPTGPGDRAVLSPVCPTSWCWSSPVPTGDDMGGFGGSSSSDVWLLPVESGSILHWDGRAWSRVASGTAEVLDQVWSASPTVAWAVGRKGTIVAWDGTAWSAQKSGVSAEL
jgi:hypothetical protein